MNDFIDSLHAVFERLGRIQTRRMFGGHGIYHEGRMIALVAGGTLYLKADAPSAPDFDRLQLPAFSYRRGDAVMQMSYRQAPADLFDDRETAALWGRRAYEAALRSGQSPKPRKPRPPRKPETNPKTANESSSTVARSAAPTSAAVKTSRKIRP